MARNEMYLEWLPNEILFNLFEYLKILDIFRAFYGLNHRFDTMVLDHCRKCDIDCRSTTKQDFDIICKNYLPLIVNQISSIHLSDSHNTPEQISIFLSYNFQWKNFINLQKISLSNLHSSDILRRLLTNVSQLISLKDLRLKKCLMPIDQTSANEIYDKIWSLPTLNSCHIDIDFSDGHYFPIPTVTSTSLKHLSISNITCCFNEFIHLCESTPNLQYLSVHIMDYDDPYPLLLPILPITHLKLSFDSSSEILQCILQNTPSLNHLTIETYNIYMDGYEWEEMIRQYIPKLKKFQFKMRFTASNFHNKDIESDQILNSFRTKFWIDEHQWFVRCHWYSSDEQGVLDLIDLFTLPYAFEEFLSYTGCTLVKSTCPTDDKHWSFDHVHHLRYGSSHFLNSIMSRVRFSRIEHLSLSLPFNDRFLSVVSKLDRLMSLFISVNNHKKSDNILSQLQMLLDQAPRLYSLSLGPWSSSSLSAPLIDNTSESIRELNFQKYTCGKNRSYFDDEQCRQFSRSPLGKQCQTLLIKVKNRKSIPELVNNMPNLQALNVRCEDDRGTNNQSDSLLSTKDEFLEWLRCHMPASSMIMRDTCHMQNIRLWIR